MKQLQRLCCLCSRVLPTFGKAYGANLKPDSKDTEHAKDERTVEIENLKLKAKTDTNGKLTTNRY